MEAINQNEKVKAYREGIWSIPGSKQSMQYEDSDTGPCYLNDDEIISKKYEVSACETKEPNLTKCVLV